MSKKIFISPRDKEVVDCLFMAACQAFEIDKELLMSDMAQTVVSIRHMVIYLIANNTSMNNATLAAHLERRPFAIQKAVEKIEVHRKIYWQTVGNLNLIIQHANNFDKQHIWHIKPFDRN